MEILRALVVWALPSVPTLQISFHDPLEVLLLTEVTLGESPADNDQSGIESANKIGNPVAKDAALLLKYLVGELVTLRRKVTKPEGRTTGWVCYDERSRRKTPVTLCTSQSGCVQFLAKCKRLSSVMPVVTILGLPRGEGWSAIGIGLACILR